MIVLLLGKVRGVVHSAGRDAQICFLWPCSTCSLASVTQLTAAGDHALTSPVRFASNTACTPYFQVVYRQFNK